MSECLENDQNQSTSWVIFLSLSLSLSLSHTHTVCISHNLRPCQMWCMTSTLYGAVRSTRSTLGSKLNEDGTRQDYIQSSEWSCLRPHTFSTADSVPNECLSAEQSPHRLSRLYLTRGSNQKRIRWAKDRNQRPDPTHAKPLAHQQSTAHRCYSKSPKSPASFLPPIHDFHCTFAHIWYLRSHHLTYLSHYSQGSIY